MPPDVTCHVCPFQFNVAASPARGAPASTPASATSRPRPTALVPPMLGIPLVGGRRPDFFRENRRAVGCLSGMRKGRRLRHLDQPYLARWPLPAAMGHPVTWNCLG